MSGRGVLATVLACAICLSAAIPPVQAAGEKNRAAEDYAEAARALAAGDTAGASKALSRVIESGQTPPALLVTALFSRGAIYHAKGNLDAALADYDRALDLRPDFAEVYVNRGNARYSKGNKAGALSDFDRAVELSPFSALGFNNRGYYHLAEGDPVKATDDFDRALDLSPKSPEILCNRGMARLMRDDPEGAVLDFDAALGVNPKNAMAYRGRGLAYDRLGKKDKAAADLAKSRELDPMLADPPTKGK
ncbi:tetratricopeptide repeat protein [Desulfolutivibrio sulfoxidireducens]|uniref:tetratricopeptide repeat protein n=1 Tax=Desulfolutivibrio sulfoxidireducens TaxID=2773299 RepID=UPI00159E67CD|nr:tetratricopeptide repeat protein [Desulfolutivibrio sulfoxidireducens]